METMENFISYKKMRKQEKVFFIETEKAKIADVINLDDDLNEIKDLANLRMEKLGLGEIEWNCDLEGNVGFYPNEERDGVEKILEKLLEKFPETEKLRLQKIQEKYLNLMAAAYKGEMIYVDEYRGKVQWYISSASPKTKTLSIDQKKERVKQLKKLELNEEERTQLEMAEMVYLFGNEGSEATVDRIIRRKRDEVEREIEEVVKILRAEKNKIKEEIKKQVAHIVSALYIDGKIRRRGGLIIDSSTGKIY